VNLELAPMPFDEFGECARVPAPRSGDEIRVDENPTVRPRCTWSVTGIDAAASRNWALPCPFSLRPTATPRKEDQMMAEWGGDGAQPPWSPTESFGTRARKWSKSRMRLAITSAASRSPPGTACA
jgi:hypothetical protein